jgi:carboxypeptidase C (cathepsin A)
MGSFGPKRVDIPADKAAGGAPYRLVDNADTILVTTDLVFVDAPATGFGHIRGENADKLFLGIDGDAATMTRFIMQFIESHNRYNSPKFIFGESYGTTRAAVVSNMLSDRYSIDINGVVLLSQILVWDNNADTPQANPGVDQPYALALPTYAATAWYHHKLNVNEPSLETFLKEVEQFALTEYSQALAQGRRLEPAQRAKVIEKLVKYTGLSAELWDQADLRINVGVFTQNVLGRTLNAGRLDTRFVGLSIDPLAKESAYDPQSSAISSAYVSLFNDYVRRELKFGQGLEYHSSVDFGNRFSLLHRPPGESEALPQTANVAIDLGHAMITNPHLHVMLNAGYFDLATPFFAADFELDHLPINGNYLGRIDRFHYESGHMIYVIPSQRAALSENLVKFIQSSQGSH